MSFYSNLRDKKESPTSNKVKWREGSIAVVDDEGYLEIPIGFNPEFGEISGIAEELLTEEEIENFFK